MKNSKQILDDILVGVNDQNVQVGLSNVSASLLGSVVSLLKVNEIEKALLVLQEAFEAGLIPKEFRNYIGDHFGDPYKASWFATVEYPAITDDIPVLTPLKEPVKEPEKEPVKSHVKKHVEIPAVAHVSKKKHA